MTKSKLSPALQKAHEAKKMMGTATKDRIVTAIRSTDQPLTAGEVASLIAMQGKPLDKNYVRVLMLELVEDGKLHTRFEKPDEREIRLAGRSNFGTGSHIVTSYFMAPGNKTAKRTKHTDKVVTMDKALLRKMTSKKNIRPAKAKKVQTGSPREKSLLARIADLEAKIARIEKILG
jgi:hypothetical protein